MMSTIIRDAVKDVAAIWKSGYTHSWLHEQNIRLSGVTDLTGAKYMAGFNAVANDVTMLTRSLENVFKDKIAVRHTLTDELNKILDLNLRPDTGTVTIAAEVYLKYQKKEKDNIKIVLEDRELCLSDVRLK